MNSLIKIKIFPLLIGFFSVLILLFFNGIFTIAGIPASILVKFLRNPPALSAFFTANRQKFHDQLQKIGIEDDVKDFYRNDISDEIELDRYIHQLFFNLTGYVGYNYDLSGGKILTLKQSAQKRLSQEIQAKSLQGKTSNHS